MEQDAESLLWSTYRTIGAGWPDYYALLREPREAGTEALRLSINALYAHAGANRDHRDIRRRFYYQMLQEKVLPEARRILLDESARRSYDEQWQIHASNLPGAISYEHFLGALPSASQASSQLDVQIAQELTARLEAQLALQRAAQEKTEMSEDEMGALPVTSAPEASLGTSLAQIATARAAQPRQPELIEPNPDEPDPDASAPPEEPEPEPPLNLQVLAVKETPRAPSENAAPEGGDLRGRGGRLLQYGVRRSTAPHAAGSEEAWAGAASDTGARTAGGASMSRIVVGLSNEEMRAIGRRSQWRWARRSAIRLALGGAAIALAASGLTWALLGRNAGIGGTAAEAHLQTAVESAIYRAIARSEQARSQRTGTQAAGPQTAGTQTAGTQTAGGAQGASASTGAASQALREDVVAANVPTMRLDTLLQNADFEGLPGCSNGDLKPWQVWSGTHGTGQGAAFAVGAGKEQDARSGRWRLVFWKATPYEASVFQIVKNLRPGLYQLNAWTKCSGGQDWAGAVVADYGGPRLHVAAIPSSRWAPLTIRNIRVTNGQCKIGFYTRSLQGRKWLSVDAVEFHPQG